MPHEELLTKISLLRAHVQGLRKESESDEPMLDTIYDTLKELEWSLFLEFHQRRPLSAIRHSVMQSAMRNFVSARYFFARYRMSTCGTHFISNLVTMAQKSSASLARDQHR